MMMRSELRLTLLLLIISTGNYMLTLVFFFVIEKSIIQTYSKTDIVGTGNILLSILIIIISWYSASSSIPFFLRALQSKCNYSAHCIQMYREHTFE